MICLDLTQSGFYPQNPQPSDFSTCSYVLQSGAEASGSFFSLTSDQGATLAISISVLWAIGAVFRVLINLMRPSPSDSTEHS